MRSVDEDDEGADSPHSTLGSGPNVQALGAALEHPPEPVNLKVPGPTHLHYYPCNCALPSCNPQKSDM